MEDVKAVKRESWSGRFGTIRDDTVARFDNTFVIVANDLRNARDLKVITTRLTNVLRHRGPYVSAELVDANSSPAQVLATIESL